MFNLDYIKLSFKIRFLDNGELVEYKNSAIRGILGEALINEYCIKDKPNCNLCKTSQKCGYREVFYPTLDIEANSTLDNSVPAYIIQCYERKRDYKKDDTLDFNIILFNRGIPYITSIIRAVKAIGRYRGLNNIRFILEEVTTGSDKIFINNEILKSNIIVRNLKDYIVERECGNSFTLEFITPFRLKKEGRLTNKVNIEDIVSSIARRLEKLQKIQKNKTSIDNIAIMDIKAAEIKYNLLEWKETERYSSRQRVTLKLGGVMGAIEVVKSNDYTKKMLVAGELIQIGKNTSFGLGQYKLK